MGSFGLAGGKGALEAFGTGLGSFGECCKWFHFVRVGFEIGFVWCGVFPGREHRRRRPGRRQARRPAPLGSFGAKVFSAGEAAFLEWALGSLGVEATGSAGASLDNIVINSKIVRGCAWDIAKCFTVIAKLVVTEVFGGSGAGRQFAVAKRRRKGAYLAEGASRAPWRGNSMNQEVPSCDGR